MLIRKRMEEVTYWGMKVALRDKDGKTGFFDVKEKSEGGPKA